MAKIESIAVATVRVPLDRVTSFATRSVSARDYGLVKVRAGGVEGIGFCYAGSSGGTLVAQAVEQLLAPRSEEHTSELQSHSDLVCRLLLEKKNTVLLQTAVAAIRAAITRKSPSGGDLC